MSLFGRARSYIVTHKVISAVATLVIVGCIGILAVASSASRQGEVVAVSTVDLKDTVLINGKVRAAQNVDLSVDKTGRVSAVLKKVGDKLKAGDVIVTTDAAELAAQLERARATLQGAQARLTQLSTADRPEEVAIAEQGIISAEAELSAARADMLETIRSGYISVDDAIRNKADQFIVGGTRSPRISFPVIDSDLSVRITQARPRLEMKLDEVRNKILLLNEDNADTILLDLRAAITASAAYLNDFSFALNNLTASEQYPQASISIWKQTMGSARTDISSVSDDLTAAAQRLSNAKTDLLVAHNELTIRKTGGSQSDIAVQVAAVAQARADVSAAAAALEDTLIRAPFAGTLTRVDAEIGRTIIAQESVVSLVSEGALEIEGYVPEVSVSRVKVGAAADITLDAFGSTALFPATVSAVDLSGQTINGVQSYKVRLVFTQLDERIKIGMTANARVVTQIYEDALSVPRAALILKNGKQYVYKVTSESPLKSEQIEVQTGIASENQVQIISGLSAEDKVVVTDTETAAL